MTIDEVVEKRIERVRLPDWLPEAYLKLDFMDDGMHGPWVHLVSPLVQKTLQIEIGSQDILVIEAFGVESDWEEFKGVPYFGF